MKIISNRSQQQGSSLMEVMVSSFVLAIGLLGTLAMQSKAVVQNQQAYAATQAIVLATDIVERIRANPDPKQDYSYNTSKPINGTCSDNCSAEQIRDRDLTKWKTNLSSFLPEGSAEIKRLDADQNTYEVVISYNDTRKQKEISTLTEGKQSYVLRVSI